jgi:hypothetical protein
VAPAEYDDAGSVHALAALPGGSALWMVSYDVHLRRCVLGHGVGQPAWTAGARLSACAAFPPLISERDPLGGIPGMRAPGLAPGLAQRAVAVGQADGQLTVLDWQG